MKHLFTTIALLIMAAATAGAKSPTDYSLDVKEFSRLKVVDGINVDYRHDRENPGKVTFTTTADKASVLMFSNEKGTLTIRLATEGTTIDDLPTVTVGSSFLDKIENSGDSTVRVLSVAPCPRFQATLMGNGRLVLRDVEATNVDLSIKSGNGTLTASGNATDLKISLMGTGTIQADDLKANNVRCRATGTGAIGCHPLTELKVLGAGSTTIYYKGTPQISNRSVGLKVTPLDPK